MAVSNRIGSTNTTHYTSKIVIHLPHHHYLIILRHWSMSITVSMTVLLCSNDTTRGSILVRRASMDNDRCCCCPPLVVGNFVWLSLSFFLNNIVDCVYISCMIASVYIYIANFYIVCCTVIVLTWLTIYHHHHHRCAPSDWNTKWWFHPTHRDRNRKSTYWK